MAHGPALKSSFFISIRTKFWLLVAFLIIATIIINTFNDLRHVQRIIQEEIETKARSIAASLSLEGTEAMIENLYLIQNSLSNFSELPGVSQILFIDDSSMVAAANDISKIGDVLSNDPLFNNAVKQHKETLEYYKDPKGENLLAIFEPMYLNGKIHGWIRLDLSLKETEDKIRKNLFQMILLALFITGAAIVSTFAISQTISNLLKNLVNKFKKLANGDFTEKLNIHSNDELGEVAQSYNLLVDQMRSMVHQLDQKRKKAEADLRDSEEFFRALYENAKHPVYVFGEDLRFIDANPYASDFYGYSLGEFKQMKVTDLASVEEKPLQEENFKRICRKEGFFIKELKQQKRNGEVVTITADHVRVIRSGKNYYVSKITDITERKLAEEQLRYLANYDILTDLPNRTLFIDRFGQALSQAKRNQKLVAVLFVDLDQFKLVNDTLGHAVGDQLLKAISKTLVTVRETDTVSRLGGDEFTIILTNITHVEDAARVAEGVLHAVSRSPFQVAGQDVIVTASVGIAIYPNDGEDVETLVKNADAAMYRAKEKGKNNFQFYTPDMNKTARKRLELETRLRRAVENKEFLLHYQPIVDLKTGKIAAAEALLRWRPPTGELIQPNNFIPLAEETRLIVPMGQWAIETACRQNKIWQEAGLSPICMAINLSVYQFQDRHFVENVLNVLNASGLDSAYVELELTESNLMQNVEKAKSLLDQINQLGVKISVDDFGTGYSSLNYLHRLPIDTLKIDRAFIKDIDTPSNSATIVKTIIALAHSLNFKVVAEGVETERQLEFLLACQCDRMQGYLFFPPLPSEEFETLLSSGQCLNVSRYKKSKAGQ